MLTLPRYPAHPDRRRFWPGECDLAAELTVPFPAPVSLTYVPALRERTGTPDRLDDLFQRGRW
jgi:hypothetical protein